MVDNSNIPHPKCLRSKKNPSTKPKACEKGPKLEFEYLPTSKTSHYVRTACMAFPWIQICEKLIFSCSKSGPQDFGHKKFWCNKVVVGNDAPFANVSLVHSQTVQEHLSAQIISGVGFHFRGGSGTLPPPPKSRLRARHAGEKKNTKTQKGTPPDSKHRSTQGELPNSPAQHKNNPCVDTQTTKPSQQSVFVNEVEDHMALPKTKMAGQPQNQRNQTPNDQT